MSTLNEIDLLKRSARRWKMATIISWAAFAVILAIGGGTMVTRQHVARERAMDAERAARQAEEEARRLRASEAAERAAAEKNLAEAQAERKRAELALYAQTLQRAQDALEKSDK